MAMLNNQRVYSLDMEYDLSTIHIISDIIFSNDIPYDINTLLIGVFVYVDGLIDGLTHRIFLSTAWWPAKPPIGRLFWWRRWRILALENLGVTVVEVGFWPISEQFSFKQLCLMVKDPSLDPWISYDYKLKKQNQSMFGNSLKRDSSVFLDIFVCFSKLW